MTKDQYYEMCSVLGEPVVEENIPVDFEDLPLVIQVAMGVYRELPDNWDSMSGEYLGKIKYNLRDTFEFLDIDPADYREMFSYINLIDRVRSELIAIKRQATKSIEKPMQQ